MFVRRHYYDIASGETVLSYMLSGDVLTGSIDKDYKRQEALQSRDQAETGCFEWFEPDDEIESKFAQPCVITVVDGELVFTPIEKPEEPTYEELMEAYTILTGGDDA